ncbi:MAG: peptidoglycan DD-metalloendopeptidase family protein [Bacteroidetes bacterium]|nr:peptidoglycan DD-metalloendopeptidase family protein [Bacteroidota bacterium]
MRLLIVLSFFLLNSFFCIADGGDSLMTFRSRIKHRREGEHLLIAKMSDEQFLRLVNHLFEASYIPPDIWEKIMLETAKRNLHKESIDEITGDALTKPCGLLFIDKMQPDSIIPFPIIEPIDSRPASNYYSEWDEDISNLFKDQFAADTTYQIELENPQFGCFKMPAWGPLSSPYGLRHRRYHKGIDIQLRKGDTITVAFCGMVRFAQKKGGFGNVVIVRHYNGLETVYAHLSKINVQEGQLISTGDLIGLAGSTGHSTGPHLHFEIRFMGLPIDPQYILSLDYGNLLFNTVTLQKQKSGLLSAYHPDIEFHTAVKGETLLEIANHYGVTSAKIREMNHMGAKQYVRIKQGQILRVRTINNSESFSTK